MAKPNYVFVLMSTTKKNRSICLQDPHTHKKISKHVKIFKPLSQSRIKGTLADSSHVTPMKVLSRMFLLSKKVFRSTKSLSFYAIDAMFSIKRIFGGCSVFRGGGGFCEDTPMSQSPKQPEKNFLKTYIDERTKKGRE